MGNTIFNKYSMKFNCGDVVIKTTGGNKMTISEKIEDGYKCLWFVVRI